MANNRRELRRLGITHVLNASHSRWRGTPEAYEGLGIRYLGVEAHDSPAFDMSIHFQTAADFIHRALSQPGGRRECRRGGGSNRYGVQKPQGSRMEQKLGHETNCLGTGAEERKMFSQSSFSRLFSKGTRASFKVQSYSWMLRL